jgi:branched-chain amino acid transport system substrate-binding protein
MIAQPCAPRRRRARRLFLLHAAASATAPALLSLPALAQARTLRVASTFDNSGVEKANGSGAYRGASAYFNALNRSGGVGGAKVELLMADDQFKPDLAKQNALAFAADKSVLALLSPLGTRQTAAMMEAVTSMAIVGPITGTAGLRKSSPPAVFWVRASYDVEVDKLIATAATLGQQRIGFVYPNDPLGKSVLAGFENAMALQKLKATVMATTPGTTSPEVEPAAEAIAKAGPQVVIMALAGMAPKFVKALRQAGSAASVYGLSISMSPANVEALGEQGRGVGFAIVVPSPFSAKHEVVRRYQADMAASGWTDFGLPSLEGYINARVLAEGLRRAGPSATRESLLAALESIENFDVGGLRVGYGKSDRLGSRFVDVAVLGQGGRFIS